MFPIISNPKHGWCNFDLGDFHGSPSYITDVPCDLLNCFISYKIKGVGTAWFDEEGTEFTLILNPSGVFIIEEKEIPVLHDYYDINIDVLIGELISDLKADVQGWAEFVPADEEAEFKVQSSKGRDNAKNEYLRILCKRPLTNHK